MCARNVSQTCITCIVVSGVHICMAVGRRSDQMQQAKLYSRDEKYSGHRRIAGNKTVSFKFIGSPDFEFSVVWFVVCLTSTFSFRFRFVLFSLLTFLVCIEFITRHPSAYGTQRPTYATTASTHIQHTLEECKTMFTNNNPKSNSHACDKRRATLNNIIALHVYLRAQIPLEIRTNLLASEMCVAAATKYSRNGLVVVGAALQVFQLLLSFT